MSVQIDYSESDIDSWIANPITQLYIKHLNRHVEIYKRELLSGSTLSNPENAIISTAKAVGAIEALETKQQLIFFDMKRDITDDREDE